jgi:hypothetical protein
MPDRPRLSRAGMKHHNRLRGTNNLNLLEAKARQCAEQFGKDPVVTAILAPYDKDHDKHPRISRWFDPLLYWSLRNCTAWPRVLILLHNWGNEASSCGTVNRNAAYTKTCWLNLKRDNPSFRNMFDSAAWSRRLIESGVCLVANAAWGLWKSNKTTGMFENKQVYLSMARHLWLPLAIRIQPTRLYLCGRWSNPKGKRNRFVTEYGALSDFLGIMERALPKTKVILHWHPYWASSWKSHRRLKRY